jgi:hypothetical protein
VLNGHLSDQVAQGYCAGQPKVVLTNDGAGFEATIQANDVPGAVGHIREDRKMWFTYDDNVNNNNDSSDNSGGGDGEATSAKGPAPHKRRLLRHD